VVEVIGDIVEVRPIMGEDFGADSATIVPAPD
jgi:hypothetical protein